MAVKCPSCGKKIKTHLPILGFFSSPEVEVFTCKCGTRVAVIPGFLKGKIIDWESPHESKPKQDT